MPGIDVAIGDLQSLRWQTLGPSDDFGLYINTQNQRSHQQEAATRSGELPANRKTGEIQPCCEQGVFLACMRLRAGVRLCRLF
jgi:hypothetical protein